MAQNKHNENLPHGRYDERDKIKSGGGNQEGTSRNPSQKKKRYHRHTLHQIQELEAFFSLCPHPDDKQRKELSRQLELEPLQVKFWFQNKRTQTKTHHERYQNSKLRVENEKLKIDNMRYRAALSNSSCPNCGGPSMMGEISLEEHHLRLENAHLREELDRVAAIAAKSMGKQVNHHLLSSPSPVARRPLELGVEFGELGEHGESSNDIFRSICGPIEADKPVIVELAVAAMEEMVTMAQMGEPLWTVSLDGTTAILDEDEYFKTFPKDASPKPSGFRCEASRESAVVTMCHINLVDIFMDVNQWSAMFSGIVSRASTTEVLSTGVAGNYDGALQVMIAEFHLPSPLLPTRESYFARYCKQQDEGTWAIVDVSLDDLRPVPTARCRKRPSGCLIHEMPNGFSKVIWVEHVEVDDRGVHGLYKLLVNSGRAFGANRWVANLDRQCERFASAMTANVLVGEVGAITSLDGRRGMLKLADRMVTSFCAGVSASSAHTWTTLSGTGGDDVRVMTRKSINDPGRPPGIVLSAATSFWLPVLPKRIFDFLRDQNSRKEWDILSNGDAVQEVGRIASGRDAGNCVSLLRNANSVQGNMLIVQESYTNSTGSFVVYAPVEIAAINVVLNGGDTDYVALLPSGFAILPDGTAAQGGEVGPGGSLVTIAFQILVDSVPTAKLSLGCVATVNNLIVCTVERIKASLTCESA